ncbi:GNAT family N-acetyltransferase [Agromyces mediolanus]|uniref:N-acetyltransferase domain-containing protein n=1 Tax=Agromyces mediolanus TaxID=41986 RepID=A0A918CFK5_AGRME|nr:GNAT family N-acetyltransferase [Agromyces mediolanus]GGR18831.1 hypothetical protein GCM10010196_09970 [Agromyces mediolanus]GLJ71388.1 hypothetical protein GCM10017583_06440 [Agromyces mediolanus]
MTAELDPRHPLVQQIAAEVLRERLPGVPAELAAPLVAAQLRAKFEAMRASRPAATAELLPAGRGDADALGYLVVDRSGEELRLVDLAVRAEARGRGVASAALRSLATEADAAGRAITLSVWAGDPTERLYARHGFVRIEEPGARDAAGGYVELRRPPRPSARQSSVWTGDTSTSSSSAQ